MKARGSGYLWVAMLAAALSGRALDAGGVLPGVREAAPVRGGAAAWLVVVGCALLVAAAAGRCWGRTRSLRATAAVVASGQVVTFLAAEAVVRVANGLGPLDPDALLGAALQAALGIVLLLASSLAWRVGLRTAPLQRAEAPGALDRWHRRTTDWWASRSVASLVARGPPQGARS